MAELGQTVQERELTPVDRAQDIMYEAWEATEPERAIDLAEEALTVSPDCADAYNLLALEASFSLEESLGFYLLGVMAGERALGKRAFEQDVGHFWGLLETRPYMRSRAGLADCLWIAGQHAEAVDHWWELLRLNPNDNQGIRDVLLPALIQLGRDDDAERLYTQYKDDNMATWKYSRALLDFRKHGDSDTSYQSLEAAIAYNPHVPKYLLQPRRLPDSLPSYTGFGDDNEAICYTVRALFAWDATPGAMKWLSARAATL